MSRKPRPEPILTEPKALKVGDKWRNGYAVVTVTNAAKDGVVVSVSVDAGGTPMTGAYHVDDLTKLYPQGIPVLWEPKVFTGETTITAAGDPMTLTMGQVTSLLPDMVRNEGKAKPGERYRVTFEQLPGVE